MKALSQALIRLSILAPAMLVVGGPVEAAAPGGPSPYFGRWTVDEARPVFTARGRAYKTIDVAPCGHDFCGVSVDDSGKCGAVLFRFLSKHADGSEELHGHGKWGDAQKNIVIYDATDPEAQSDRRLELYLGDGYDFGERSGNMPKFHARYRRVSGSRCGGR
jgi:hypothetical protein